MSLVSLQTSWICLPVTQLQRRRDSTNILNLNQFFLSQRIDSGLCLIELRRFREHIFGVVFKLTHFVQVEFFW